MWTKASMEERGGSGGASQIRLYWHFESQV